MYTRRSALGLILAVLLGLLAGSAQAADPGVTATEVKLGNTNPYSGPASAYGTIGKAIGAYFKKVNEEGGINGRKINFVTLDDAYSPPKAVEMVRKLVEDDKVLLLFQTLGTPSNSAIWRYMNDEQVPQLFVATGATKWGDPKGHPWTMGWQPTYQAEAVIIKNICLWCTSVHVITLLLFIVTGFATALSFAPTLGDIDANDPDDAGAGTEFGTDVADESQSGASPDRR